MTLTLITHPFEGVWNNPRYALNGRIGVLCSLLGTIHSCLMGRCSKIRSYKHFRVRCQVTVLLPDIIAL